MNTLHPTLSLRPTLPIMGHLVLGYPSLAASMETAEAYVRAGIEILELQIPFSHPTADGPVITFACQEATRQGTSVQDCIGAIRAFRERHPTQEIMVMSYVNRVYAYGLEKFGRAMTELSVRRLIVPDLPVDSEVALAFKAHHSSLQWAPVLAANISGERLEKLLGMDFDFFYLMSDFKITGSGFSLNPQLREMIAKIRQPRIHQGETISACRIGIGFGVSTPEQARIVASEADIAIIGSALIQAQQAGRLEAYLSELLTVFGENHPS